MKIIEHRCPQCGAALQPTRVGEHTIRACPCGYGKPQQRTKPARGIVTYVQQLGAATLTRLMEHRSKR